MQDTEEEQHKVGGESPQKERVSNQDTSNNGGDEQVLLGKGLKRDCWLWPWKRIFQ